VKASSGKNHASENREERDKIQVRETNRRRTESNERAFPSSSAAVDVGLHPADVSSR